MSMNEDNSHSWVRISHKQVGHECDTNEQKTSGVQFEHAFKLNASDFASRSKAKAKPQRRELADSSTRTTPIDERISTDVEQGKCSISNFAVSKKIIRFFFGHEKLHRENDGAIVQSSRTFLALSPLV